MSLTIASIGYPFAPVSPHAVGGAEQILSYLDQELVANGHTSLVVGCEGSQAAGRLYTVPLHHRGLLDEADWRQCRKRFQSVIERVLLCHSVDVIHMHGLDFYEYMPATTIPVLVTLHLPVSWYPRDIWTRYDSHVQFQCVSRTQRASCPPEARDVAVVSNGVSLQPPRGVQKGDYAIALGRICPEKNLHEALAAGTLAGTRVLIGGQVFPYRDHEQYFHQKLKPLLQTEGSDVRHEFLGPLEAGRKHQLLAEAKCLLHPTLAPETSSLVAMEALAAGTPVIAYRSGALPEIIEEGVTGFLVDNVEQMAAAIAKAGMISPRWCRQAAERRFSKQGMLRGYFDLYQALVQKHSVAQYCA